MSDELRDELVGALTNVLSNVSNYPERVQSRLLGTDTEPLRTKVIDAILPIIASKRAAARAGALREAADAFERGDVLQEEVRRSSDPPWNADCVAEIFDNSSPIMDWLRARAAGTARGETS